MRFTKVLGSLGSALPSPGSDTLLEDDWDGSASDDHSVGDADKETYALTDVNHA